MLKIKTNCFLFFLCLCVALSNLGGLGMADTESVKKRREFANRFFKCHTIYVGV